MKTITHETNIDQMLANFKKNLYIGEQLDSFLNKSNAFMAFFHELSTTSCENIDLIEHAKNAKNIINKIIEDVTDNPTIKTTDFYHNTVALARLSMKDHLEIIPEITEMIGDYYNSVCSYGLYEKDKDISEKINDEDFMDLMDKLGIVYAITFDKLEELEKNMDEDEHEFE